jgi:hypothetical protein
MTAEIKCRQDIAAGRVYDYYCIYIDGKKLSPRFKNRDAAELYLKELQAREKAESDNFDRHHPEY